MSRFRLVLILDAELDDRPEARWHADVELMAVGDRPAPLTEKAQERLMDYAATAIKNYRENGLG